MHRPFVAAVLMLASCARSSDAPAAPKPLAALQPAHQPHIATPFELPPLAAVPKPADAKRAVPPLQLTASDGAGLQLAQLEVRAVVEGPLVLTELHATFHNPEDRVREGRFQLVLPDGAALSRFAMLQATGWMEGEVVEKARAERIYEDFLHRRQDPALLQQDGGNTFSARVFPIGAKADKSFIVTWSENLPDPRVAWRMPLRGLPKLQQFKAKVYLHAAGKPQPAAGSLGATLGQVQVVSVDKQDWQPDDDLRIDPQAAGAQPAALRAGNQVALRVQVPMGPKMQAKPVQAAVVLVDTSASAVLGWAQTLQTTDALLRWMAMQGAAHVAVLAFDQDVQPLFSGKAADWGKAEQAALANRGPLGASDWGKALDAAAEACKQVGGDEVRVFVIGDGMPTAGEIEPDALARKVAGMASSGAARIDAVTVTTARNRDLLQALTSAGLSRDGVVADAVQSDPVAQLAVPTLGAIDVDVKGANWVWPKKLRAMQPGQPALVFAELPEAMPVQVTLSGAASLSTQLEPKAAEPALLERAWVGARIAMLLHRSAEGDPDLAAALKQQAAALSVKHRVLCPLTALLVLETEADYARYAIDRSALAQVLTVTPEGAAVLEPRKALEVPNLGWRAGQGGLQQRVDAPEKAQPNRRESNQFSDTSPPAAQARASAADPMPSAAAPMESAMAKAIEDGSELVIGHGSGGMGFAGTGSGGGGSSRSAPGMGSAPKAKREETVHVGLAAGDAEGSARTAVADALARKNAQFNACYARAASKNPEIAARYTLKFRVRGDGQLTDIAVVGGDAAVQACITDVANTVRVLGKVPATERFERVLNFRAPVLPPGPVEIAAPQAAVDDSDPTELKEFLKQIDANPSVNGPLAEVRGLLAKRQNNAALARGLAWRSEAPTEVLPLVALGEALLANGDASGAARAYGSVVDLFPARADLRRFAGNLLETCGQAGSALAIDTYRKAVAQRPDHPSGTVMLAVALAQAGQFAEALQAIDTAKPQQWRGGNFNGVERGLADLRALIATASGKPEPGTEPQTLLIVSWETDANDVDTHFFDRRNAHGSYRNRVIPGGELFADITTGYGPEFVQLRSDAAFPVRLFAHYYRMGPMGWGMGRLQVIRFDGKALRAESRPFVLMANDARVELGTVAK